jgi:hypothetical protein
VSSFAVTTGPWSLDRAFADAMSGVAGGNTSIRLRAVINATAMEAAAVIIAASTLAVGASMTPVGCDSASVYMLAVKPTEF